MADRKRCAIYTRKSTEEGLEQDFNSLDAQREACAAYILSQAAEGWEQVKEHYDDGGWSGGAVRGGTDVGGRPPEPAGRVTPIHRMVGDPGHRQWVHGLQQQGPHPADQHGGVAVDPPARTARAEQAGIAGDGSSQVAHRAGRPGDGVAHPRRDLAEHLPLGS